MFRLGIRILPALLVCLYVWQAENDDSKPESAEAFAGTGYAQRRRRNNGSSGYLHREGAKGQASPARPVSPFPSTRRV